jgi:hypothetical protein
MEWMGVQGMDGWVFAASAALLASTVWSAARLALTTRGRGSR